MSGIGPGENAKFQDKQPPAPSTPIHTTPDPDPAPLFNQTAFAAELTHPNRLHCEPQVVVSAAPNADTTHTTKAATNWLHKTLGFATSLATSNNFYTSVGNIIITSNLYSGALLHPACAILAITNEAREGRRERGEYSHPAPKFTGITQKAIDLWRSPGIYRVALSGAFFLNTLESAAKGNALFAAIFLCASLGNIGAAQTLNRDYFRSLYAERGLERPPKELTALSLVTNPGINWSITDVLVGMMTLPSLGTLGTTMAYSAAACACAAVVAPLMLGRRAASSPILLALNAACNFGFSAVHAVWGTTTIALSCCGWGIASALIALKQHKQNVQKQSHPDL